MAVQLTQQERLGAPVMHNLSDESHVARSKEQRIPFTNQLDAPIATHIFQDSSDRCLLIPVHEVTSAGDYFDAIGAFQLLDKRLQLIQWANFIEFTGDKEFGAFKDFGKSARCAK